MRFVNWLKSTPLWLLMPAIGVAAAAALAFAAYEPLSFDPSLYATPTALASELKTIDAEALEAEHAEAAGADASASLTAAAIATGVLADGTWTGYAACGTGNPDGWKPYYVAVTITVSGGKVRGITDIYGTSQGPGATLAWDAAENQLYLDWAASGRAAHTGVRQQLDAQIARSGSVSGIDTVSGATYSSVAIYNAYANAVAQSAAAAGRASSESAVQQEVVADQDGSSTRIDARTVGKLADGAWTGYAACGIGNDEEWKPYYVGVTAIVEDGKPTRIEKIFGSSHGDEGEDELDWDAAENQPYLDWASDGRTRGATFYTGVSTQIATALSSGEELAGIDTVSGATYSSISLFNAYYAALAKSAAAAGSTLDVPQPALPDPEDGREDVQPSDPSDGSSDDSSDQPGQADPPESGTFVDGTYTGHAFCQDLDSPQVYSPYYLFVTIEVEDGKVKRITDIWGDAEGLVDPAYRYDEKENLSYLHRAINGYGLRTKGMKAKIQAKLDDGKAVDGIDAVSGATWSSKSILEAYQDAVRQASRSE